MPSARMHLFHSISLKIANAKCGDECEREGLCSQMILTVRNVQEREPSQPTTSIYKDCQNMAVITLFTGSPDATTGRTLASGAPMTATCSARSHTVHWIERLKVAVARGDDSPDAPVPSTGRSGGVSRELCSSVRSSDAVTGQSGGCSFAHLR